MPEAAHVKGLMGQFTERARSPGPGGAPRRSSRSSSSPSRAGGSALEAARPTDGSAPGPGFAGAIGWSWETLLSNRPLDLWMHEQDIRRATGRPGHLDSAGARHTGTVFSASLPFVLGKKVKAAPGTTAVLTVTDGPYAGRPLVLAATVGEDGRGAALSEPPASPDVQLTLGFEDWTVLAGGRRGRADVSATVDGRHRARRAAARRDGGDPVTAPGASPRCPDLAGRRALVTGVTSGLGEHVATELARAGADVVLAARNPEKLAETAPVDHRRGAAPPCCTRCGSTWPTWARCAAPPRRPRRSGRSTSWSTTPA